MLARGQVCLSLRPRQRPHPQSSCPAKAGHPVRRGLSVQSLLPLDTGSPAFAGEDEWRYSRGMVSPELCKFVGPLENRGRREDRLPTAPAVSCAKRTVVDAHEHTGSAETARPSPRNGFTAYFALSPVSGLFCHRRRRDTSRQLSASIAAPGPHDFAVPFRAFVRRENTPDAKAATPFPLNASRR